MGRYPTRASWCCLAVTALAMGLAAHAHAIIIHPDTLPPGDVPDAALLACWGANASAVVISPTQVITTAHQGGGVGTVVHVDGASYRVASVTPIAGADLRIAELETPAGDAVSFDRWATLYTGNNPLGQTVVMAGFGWINGDHETGGVEWAEPHNNPAPGFGANVIDRLTTMNHGPYSSRVWQTDFDRTGYVPGEAALARTDSGGGWFVYADGRWQLVGLGAYVERLGFTQYGDRNWAIDLTAYAPHITPNLTHPLPEPAALALLSLGSLFVVRRERPKH